MGIFCEENQKRMSSIRTRTSVDLIRITRADFNVLIKHMPSIKQIFEKEIKRRRKDNIEMQKEEIGMK